MKKMIKKIAILTSGGDSQGMNSCISAIAKAAIYEGLEVAVVFEGYKGLVEGKINSVDREYFLDITDKSGTYIYSSRFPEFKEEKAREKAISNLKKHCIDVLIVIGGDGSYKGAHYLYEAGIKVITIPATIDMDIASSEYTIGFDSTLNVIVNSIDNIRDTANSHGRIMFVETMGRYCGNLALYAAIAVGADVVSTTENKLTKNEIVEQLKNNIKRNKRYQLVVVTEFLYDIKQLAKEVEKEIGVETRATVIGSIQRGGKPSARDRIIASNFGVRAIDEIKKENFGIALAYIKGKIKTVPLKKAITQSKSTLSHKEAIQIIKRLA